MRYIKLLVASVILVSMSACVTDNQSDMDTLGYIKTINIVGPDEIAFEQIDGSAQTKATSVSNSGVLVFNWAAGDTLGIFPNKGNQVEFPITAQEGSTSASFDGGGWALRNNASYAAYYPFSVWNYFRNNQAVILDYSGQVQNGNGSFDHLSAYDYLASAKTTPKNSTVTFQMDRQGSILYIDIVVPEPATITSLTISCNEAIFVEKAALDISGNNPVVTPIETKESLTLTFENTTTTEQNETVRAYMAVHPVDFSSKTVTATLVTDAGTYTAPVVSRVVNKGKAAFLRFSDSFTDGSTETTTPPNNEIWYTSTDGNIVEPAVTTGFGANIVSNTYENGKGVIRFDGPVTAIGGSAFGNYKCKTLATIEIPTSVTTIGGGAFTACEYLSWPDIPASVTKIGRSAFFGCDGFVDVVIPDTVTEFGESIFQGCENLRSITSAYSSADKRCLIVDGVLNSFAFAGLGDTYVFPDNITSIGNSALRNNWYSGNLVIGDNVTRIEIEAFAYMGYIKSIRIGNNVSYIGSSAFRCFGNRARVELELPASLTTLGGGVFTCSLTKLTIHAEVPPTAEYAILCEGDVIDNENPIEPYPIYVPAQSVEAYKTDQYWGAYADRIQAIPNAQPNNEIWYTTTDEKIVSLTETYLSEFGANLVSNTYANGKGVISFDGDITAVAGFAFSGCSTLRTVLLPEDVSVIGSAAFQSCSNLETIYLPDNVRTIKSSAFNGCYKLSNVDLPRYLVSIEGAAFAHCSSIVSLDFPDTFESLGTDMVFGYCTSLERFSGKFASQDGRCLIINNKVWSFAPYGLTDYTIPDGVTGIGEASFFGCSKLTSIVIPDSVTEIGKHAFCFCESISTYDIPDGVTSVGRSAFSHNNALESFTGALATDDGRGLVIDGKLVAFAKHGLTSWEIPSGITAIGPSVFFYCDKLTGVTIPQGVTEIGEDAFGYCSSLQAITIPDGVTKIGESAFRYCTCLQSITIPQNVASIGIWAFSHADSITEFYVLPTVPPSIESSLISSPEYTIYVPAASVEAYKTARYWSSYADRIQAIPSSAGGGNEGTSEEAWN